MNQNIKSKGVLFGVFFGIYLISILLYAYLIDQNFFTSYWWMGLTIAGFFIHSIWVIGSLKKELNGIISFKEAFSVFFIANSVGFLLSTIATILLFVIIDPELQNIVKELTVAKTTEMMENLNMEASKIETSVNEIRLQNNYAIGVQIKAYFFTLIFTSIFGVLFSLVLRKDK